MGGLDDLKGQVRHEAQIRDRVTRLTKEDLEVIRSKNEPRLNDLTDEDIRILRGEMRRMKRDGYSIEDIARITDCSEEVVHLLFEIRQLEVEDVEN